MTADQLIESRNKEINELFVIIQQKEITIKERDIRILQLEQQVIDLTIKTINHETNP